MSAIINPTTPDSTSTIFSASLIQSSTSTDGNDRFNGTTGDDVIFTYQGNDQVNAGTGNDVVFGDSGNDALDGGAGNDYVIGGEGSDTLEGGAGSDTLTGDYTLPPAIVTQYSLPTFADTFRFGDATTTPANAGSLGTDTVTDFRSGEDKMALSAVTYGFAAAGPLAAADFVTVSGGAAAADAAAQKIVYDTSSGSLYFNNDAATTGSATAFVKIAELSNNPTVVLSDLQIF